jgi:hypothetical protein
MPKCTEPRRRQLDELIRVSAAQNTLIGIENLTEEQIAEIRQSCAVRLFGVLRIATHGDGLADVARTLHIIDGGALPPETPFLLRHLMALGRSLLGWKTRGRFDNRDAKYHA